MGRKGSAPSPKPMTPMTPNTRVSRTMIRVSLPLEARARVWRPAAMAPVSSMTWSTPEITRMETMVLADSTMPWGMALRKLRRVMGVVLAM